MILNSRGEPTVEVAVATNAGSSIHRASAPSGASRGEHEAKELRDPSPDFGGRGVNRAIDHVNQIIGPALKGQSVFAQEKIDNILIDLDGHADKSRLGSNAILPVSLAVSRAAASLQGVFLWQYLADYYRGFNRRSRPKMPRPCFNVINGGAHAGNWLDFQEFMVVPQEKSFGLDLKAGSELYLELRKEIIEEIGRSSVNIGDEGGFAPALVAPESALDLILAAARKTPGGANFKLGLDCAANEFFRNGHYRLGETLRSAESMIDYYQKITETYPIIFLEDPLAEDDWTSWGQLTAQLGEGIDIIGDDLTVTNLDRIKQAKRFGAANGLVIKPNQIGTLTECLQSAAAAASFGWRLMVSHRSGDTNDDFIADLAVGLGADYFKSGAPARGERVAKYNRLLEIEQERRDAE